MIHARAVLAAGLLMSLVGACSSQRPEQPAGRAMRASLASPWVKVRKPDGISLLELPAQVLASPQSTGAIAPPYPARIVRVFVQPGQRVERGSPVVEVVMPQLSGAAGAYAAAHTRLEAYGQRRKQLEGLRVEGLARTTEIAEVDMRIAEARADQQTALAALRGAGFAPADVPRILDGGGAVTLRSPVQGIVTQVNAVLGETRENGGVPFARVVGEASARIEARVSHRLPEGARFEFVSQGGERVPVRLIAQAALVDARDGTVPSWFEPEVDTKLPAGLSGRLRILLDSAGAVVVPARAIGVHQGASYVVVRRGAREERVEVKVLASSGADALVLSSLVAGGEIAAEAAAFVSGTDAGP